MLGKYLNNVKLAYLLGRLNQVCYFALLLIYFSFFASLFVLYYISEQDGLFFAETMVYKLQNPSWWFFWLLLSFGCMLIARRIWSQDKGTLLSLQSKGEQRVYLINFWHFCFIFLAYLVFCFARTDYLNEVDYCQYYSNLGLHF